MRVPADSVRVGSEGASWFSILGCPCEAAGGDWRKTMRVKGRSNRIVVDGERRSSLTIDCRPVKANGGVRKLHVARQLIDESDRRVGVESEFTNFREDPMVGKLRSQLGMIQPIPAPPINRNVAGLFLFFFFCGVVSEKLWNSGKRILVDAVGRDGAWPRVPTSFSQLLEKDLQRKESVEWVNMVVGKLWKVYREGLENWIVGLLQPVIDDLKKPGYVDRVEIKQFSLGEEPLSVRNVERKTSRLANDLQYHIGLRYTGDARMLLSLKLKFGIIPIVVPVSIRDFDIDGELWVKLRLVQSEPWVGNVALAFVSLPKIKFELSPFRLFNLMAIPVLSMFLLKLLTEDLPHLFVRPKKIVLDFQRGQALGPLADDFSTQTVQEKNKNFVGELSITLVDARQLPYAYFAKTDPYVVLSLGDQVIRSKKNSQTTVIGPPGEPIWNQDFHMLVANPRKEKLRIQIRDSIGLTDVTVGTGEVELMSLLDTVPTDRIVSLCNGFGFFIRRSSGEILLRLTYKAYVEDEEDEKTSIGSENDLSDDEIVDDSDIQFPNQRGSESFMDVLTALLLSEEFQDIMATEAVNRVSEGPIKTITPGSSDRKANVFVADPENSSRSPNDGTLIWLAALTGFVILASLNFDGSSFFNL